MRKKPKVQITIRLDQEIISWLKTEAYGKGMGWQTLLQNKLLESKNAITQDDIKSFIKNQIRSELKKIK